MSGNTVSGWAVRIRAGGLKSRIANWAPDLINEKGFVERAGATHQESPHVLQQLLR